VPKMLLKRFGSKKQIWTRDCVRKTNFEGSIRKLAAKKNYYTVGKGLSRNLVIEDQLGNVESVANEAFAKIEEGKLDREVADICCEFMAIQSTRVPHFEKLANSIAKVKIKEKIDYFLTNRAALIEFLEEQYENDSKKIASSIELLSSIAPENYKVEISSRVASLLAMDDAIPILTSHMLQKNFHVIKSTENFDFIISDNPVVVIPPSSCDQNLMANSSIGIGIPGACIALPINPKLAILLGGEGDKMYYVNCGDAVVDSINSILAGSLTRYIFGSKDASLEQYAKIGDAAVR